MVGTASVEDVQDREETLPHADFSLPITDLAFAIAHEQDPELRPNSMQSLIP